MSLRPVAVTTWVRTPTKWVKAGGWVVRVMCGEPQCPGCHGPYAPTHTACPARPRVVDGELEKPTQAQVVSRRLARGTT